MNKIMDAESSGTKPSVLLVDDHAVMRAGMRLLLEAKTDIEVAGEAGDGEEAVALCRGLRPDLVLMDITMPRMDGIEATRRIKAEMPEVVILMLTSHVAEDLLMEAVEAGAAGYVLKGSGYGEVVEAIEAVLRGETPLDHGLAMRLLRRIAEMDNRPGRPRGDSSSGNPEGGQVANPLSARETDILRQIATGKTNRQLAAEFHVSLSTIKTHVQRVIKKLGVSDRTQASVKAIEMGLLPPSVPNSPKMAT